MYALLTAGGIPKPDEPLYATTQGASKALLDIHGKPMIQWIIDALDDAQTVHGILIIGLPADCGLTSQKPLQYLENQGGMLDNILAGIRRVKELEPTAQHVLAASSDVPAVQPHMIDWVVQTAMQTDDDLYYNVIEREVMETRFPGSRRSYTHIKGGSYCGGDINLVRTITVEENSVWNDIIESRKNVFKQASIIGWDLLFQLLLRQVTINDAVKRISQRVGLKGRALICPYAEIGMDVDKPFQLEIMRADLAQAVKP